jgi:N-acetylglucosamine kinase-like BadF-type ATPase
VAAVDLGGTWVRVVVAGAGRRRGFAGRTPGLERLPVLLRRLWRRWDVSRSEVTGLVVAARGVWTGAERQREARRLAPLARRVRVISDVEAAYRGALGEAPGVLVLAGTGSICLGRDRRGRWRRAGGLGPLLGDEGSAFWVGREWLRATSGGEDFSPARGLVRSADPVAAVAALAPRVLARAHRGHRTARRIVAGAQDALAALVVEVARGLRLPAPVRVSWAGGLLEDPPFRAGLWRAVRRHGLHPRAVAPRLNPVEAALSLAWTLR